MNNIHGACVYTHIMNILYDYVQGYTFTYIIHMYTHLRNPNTLKKPTNNTRTRMLTKLHQLARSADSYTMCS